MLIFFAEDNQNVREAVTGYLTYEGWQVEAFPQLSSLRRRLEISRKEGPLPDLLILDVMLPDGDSFSLVRELRRDSPERADTASIPFLFLTARTQEEDRIEGLQLGADDYIVKPFSPKEVVLRVQAIMRRRNPSAPQGRNHFYKGGNHLLLEKESHRAALNQRDLTLTAAEWNILIFLAENPSQVFSRLQLLEKSLGYWGEGSERTIDTHIKNLRKKLGGDGWIETVRGFGYRFSAETKPPKSSPGDLP